MGLLSLAIWTPVLFGVVLLAMGGDKREAGAVRWLALLGSVAGLAVTVPLYTGFEAGIERYRHGQAGDGTEQREPAHCARITLVATHGE